ncbi:MAG TPA: NAD(P)-dependent oxidoreductase [Geminicoccaceae bacterium]|nr:NAD(P)-dependent oxidoreductase [Geminicoccaceae bacterium]
MRVLVTGGAGFLGTALVEALAARGDEPIAFDAGVTPALRRAAERRRGVVIALGDIADMASVCRVVRGERPDAVIHGAAIVGVPASLGSPANVFRVNLGGTINLFEAMELYDLRRVIHISSEDTYGPFQADVATEDHPQNPLYAYGIAKLAVEHLGRTYRLTHGIECINLRASWVYGPDLPRPRVPRDLIEAAVDGRPLHLPSGGDSAIDHTYVDDFVAGTLRALDHAEHPHDAYNLGSGTAPTLFEMVETVRELVPGADLSIGPGAYRHGGTTPVPRKGALDCTRARETFGYAPRFDLRAGLAATIDARRRRRAGQQGGGGG